MIDFLNNEKMFCMTIKRKKLIGEKLPPTIEELRKNEEGYRKELKKRLRPAELLHSMQIGEQPYQRMASNG